MRRRLGFATAMLLAIGSGAAHAVETPYSFDTVTRVDYTVERLTIVGVLRNSTTPTTLTLLAPRYTVDSAARAGTCEPMLLMMLEKPGRYYLNIIVDPAALFHIISCGLELRT
jgi:hypothetical protein